MQRLLWSGLSRHEERDKDRPLVGRPRGPFPSRWPTGHWRDHWTMADFCVFSTQKLAILTVKSWALIKAPALVLVSILLTLKEKINVFLEGLSYRSGLYHVTCIDQSEAELCGHRQDHTASLPWKSLPECAPFSACSSSSESFHDIGS